MATAYDSVLLLAFGGPDSREEIHPFLARVLDGVKVPASRLEEVARHYESVGGRSPLRELTFRQARALEAVLKQRGYALPVYVGMRFSSPSIQDALARMTTDGITKALGLILSSHRTEASWDRYQRDVEAACAKLAALCPEINYCSGWHSEPLFIEAWGELIGAELEKIPRARRAAIPLLFTAHSVPVAMAGRSHYVEQIYETAHLIADRLGHRNWWIAYQSRSGSPHDQWLEPDLLSVLRELRSKGATELIVAPIGFVCDHVEVLYDLDIEARKLADDLGIGFYRARCVNDHPLFIRMMADLIAKNMEANR